MDHRRQILVVARNPKVADCLVAWLGDGGDREATLVTTFADAKAKLESVPDLVIAEVKLGEYNGLHVALKAESAGIPAIIVGPPDPVLQKDAESIRAIYLTQLTRTTLLETVSRVLPTHVSPSTKVLPFRARVTTIAAEAEIIWRAFSESSSSDLIAFGRTMLPS